MRQEMTNTKYNITSQIFIITVITLDILLSSILHIVENVLSLGTP